VVEKPKPDPPHIQALEALRADLPVGVAVSEWLDRHRAQVVAVIEGLMGWGELAKLLNIRDSALVSWGVRRGLRTRRPREKKKGKRTSTPLDFLRERNEVLAKKPRQVKDPQVVQVSRDFKGIKLTLTLEFLDE